MERNRSISEGLDKFLSIHEHVHFVDKAKARADEAEPSLAQWELEIREAATSTA